MINLDKIYQKRILEEAKYPFHFVKVENSHSEIRAFNPICGDRFDIYINDGELNFHGFGCTISKASTSFMVRALSGKTKIEALSIINDFLESIDQGKEIALEDLRVFEKTDNFKGRIECIILGWKAMKKYLEDES